MVLLYLILNHMSANLTEIISWDLILPISINDCFYIQDVSEAGVWPSQDMAAAS